MIVLDLAPYHAGARSIAATRDAGLRAEYCLDCIPWTVLAPDAATTCQECGEPLCRRCAVRAMREHGQLLCRTCARPRAASVGV